MAVVKQLVVGGKKEKKAKRSRRDESVSSFELPTEMSEPSDSIGDYTMLLFGEKKIGKTSLAAEMDDAVFLFFEPGGKGLRVYPAMMQSWADAKAAAKALRKDKRFKTIVVDPIDIAYKMCEQHVCRELGLDDLGDASYGKGWRACRKEFETWLVGLAMCGKGLVVISHATEQEVHTRDGESYDKLTSTMSKQAKEIVDGMVDIWAYYGYEGRRRVLQIEGDDHVAAGHRLTERFRSPDGERVRLIDMGKSPKEAYKNFVAAFNNKYVPPAEKSPTTKKKTKKTLKVKEA